MIRFFLSSCICVIVFFFSSCEIINPSEELPSYIAIDEVSLTTNYSTQGSASHNITDCWVVIDGKILGIYEMPFQVPVLAKGNHNITIYPGIKSGGSNSNRVAYPMIADYEVNDSILKEMEVLKLKPSFRYRNVDFVYLEGFDNGHSFEDNPDIQILSGEGSMEGNYMYFSLEGDSATFECKGIDLLTLQRNSKEIFLEINFKTNAYFKVGFFRRETSGSSIIEVRDQFYYTFYPTDGAWKKVYIDLTYPINITSSSEFRLYFACSKIGNVDVDKIEVAIDNIKVIHRGS